MPMAEWEARAFTHSFGCQQICMKAWQSNAKADINFCQAAVDESQWGTLYESHPAVGIIEWIARHIILISITINGCAHFYNDN